MAIRRRTLLGVSATAPLLAAARAWAEEAPFRPEPGAKLVLLRGATFLPAEGETTARHVAAFAQATGSEVQIINVNQDDLVSKMALASQVGSGPDIVWSQNTTAHLFADKLVDVTDLAEYLGGKYGGWYPVCEDYGRDAGRWICIPVFLVGSQLNYRIGWMREAGFERMPGDTAGFLKLCQGLQRIGHPAGFSFGHAVNDANNFAYWLLWAFGGQVVDEAGHPTLASPQTLAAIEFARELYPTLVQGVMGWTDISNNQAFIAGQCSLTNNGISIYVQAKKTAPEIAADMDHAAMPVGPVGHAAEQNRVDPMVIFRYTKYPNAAKALIAYLMERPQYDELITNSAGFIAQSLRGFADNPIWSSDPKIAPFGRAPTNTRSVSWPRTPDQASAAVFANFVLVDMFGSAVSGAATPQEAMRQAQRQVERIYRK
jgi:multiple sugar transport system substrate-binding protein